MPAMPAQKGGERVAIESDRQHEDAPREARRAKPGLHEAAFLSSAASAASTTASNVSIVEACRAR